MKIRKWNGTVEQDLFADLIYPKDVPEGTVRLVLRVPSGRVKENILDFNANTGITLYKITEATQSALKNALDDEGYIRGDKALLAIQEERSKAAPCDDALASSSVAT